MKRDDFDEKSPSQSGNRRRLIRVIVVESRAKNAEVLGRLLLAAGHRCLATDDADAALDAVREQKPDIAIIDLDLPDMRGHELGQQIRMIADKVRLIAMTASEAELDRTMVAGCVFDAVVLKPIAIEELLAELETVRASLA